MEDGAMRKNLFALLALLFACGTACQQKEILPEETTLPEPEKKVVITASFADPATRVSYTEDSETHKLHHEWEVGDVLIGFDDNAASLILEVTAVNGQTGVATLDVAEGELPETGSIHMVYTGDRDGENMTSMGPGGPIFVGLSNQVAATGTTVPAILTADAAVSASGIHLVFENQTAILGIKGFHGLPAGSVVESFFVEGVYNAAFIMLDGQGHLSVMAGSDQYLQNSVYIDKDGGWKADETGAVNETFYVAVLPNAQESEIRLVAYDSDDTQYINNLGSKTIAAGKYYYMNNKKLASTAAYLYFSSGEQAITSSIEEAFELACAAAEDCEIYLGANCTASADLSITDPATRASGNRSDTTPEFWITLDLSGYTLDMNGHSICMNAAGASLDITNTYGTGILLQEADVPVFVVSDGSITVKKEEEDGYYGPYYSAIIKCTSHTTGYSPIVVTGGKLNLEGGYYFFNTTARLINSTDASFAYVSKDCRFNKNPGFTASSCTLDYDHIIGKAKPVELDGIIYHYRYVDKHAAYDNDDGRFKHFTINSDGDAVYLSRFNLSNTNGQFLEKGWDYTPDATCFLNREQYVTWAGNGTPSLSQEEWNYLLFTRAASTVNGTENARYMKCTFQEKRGLLIFPDEFSWPSGAGLESNATAINSIDANYDVVIYRQFANTLIARGCVFLQADGYYVSGDGVKSANVAGNYWTSSQKSDSYSYALDFGSYRLNMSTSYDLKVTSFPNSEIISVRPYFK